MTDTRITVDVSTEALLQRARQQQAQSRQAVIQQEEEKREKARQQREAQKAGRGSVPGQSRLQGRSRAPQTGSKRREVAAGYLDRIGAGMCFYSLKFSTNPDGNNLYGSYALTTQKNQTIISASLLDSYTGPSATQGGILFKQKQPGTNEFYQGGIVPWGYASESSLGASWTVLDSPDFPIITASQAGEVNSVSEQVGNVIILPIRKRTFVVALVVLRSAYSGTAQVVSQRRYWGDLVEPYNSLIGTTNPATYSFPVSQTYYPIGGETTDTYTPHCFAVSDTKVRKIGMPAKLFKFLKENPAATQPYAAQGLGLQSGDETPYAPVPSAYGYTLGTPRTIEIASGGNSGRWSPDWLQFSISKSDTRQLVCRKIRQLDPTNHQPLDLNSGRIVPGVSFPVKPTISQDEYIPMLAWDWGNPALCRRLLLQLGFTPADLVP